MLAKAGKTQFAKFEPIKTQEICFEVISGIFEQSHVMPEPKKKQAQNPIKAVDMKRALILNIPNNVKIIDDNKHPIRLMMIMICGGIFVDIGIEINRPIK